MKCIYKTWEPQKQCGRFTCYPHVSWNDYSIDSPAFCDQSAHGQTSRVVRGYEQVRVARAPTRDMSFANSVRPCFLFIPSTQAHSVLTPFSFYRDISRLHGRLNKSMILTDLRWEPVVKAHVLACNDYGVSHVIFYHIDLKNGSFRRFVSNLMAESRTKISVCFTFQTAIWKVTAHYHSKLIGNFHSLQISFLN